MKRSLLATLLCAIGHCAYGADTDGDGLLDLIDVPGFNPNASGVVIFDDRSIQDLDGANLLTNATGLGLRANRITSLENGDFQGLGNLQALTLFGNQITTIEDGTFYGLNRLFALFLDNNDIQELNFTGATFDSLVGCNYLGFGLCADTSETTDLLLDDAVLSLRSFHGIVAVTQSISTVSLVGLSFSDRSPDDLSNLLTLEGLDNVRVDQALFDRYAADFHAFDAISGNTVTVIPEPSAIFLGATAWILGRAFRQRRHARQ